MFSLPHAQVWNWWVRQATLTFSCTDKMCNTWVFAWPFWENWVRVTMINKHQRTCHEWDLVASQDKIWAGLFSVNQRITFCGLMKAKRTTRAFAPDTKILSKRTGKKWTLLGFAWSSQLDLTAKKRRHVMKKRESHLCKFFYERRYSTFIPFYANLVHYNAFAGLCYPTAVN